MKGTLKENRDFRRLYSRGRNAAADCLAVYAMRNRYGAGRLGITAGVKLGHAVQRNRVKRLIREAYRLHKHELRPNTDLVIVARHRAVGASYQQVERAYLKCLDQLGIRQEGRSS